uniref:PPFIA binding protein 1a n=1 Tax=Nothobranchius furzeri TaxID=105023 RepID=A0A8C6P5R6_NOTFU
SSPTSPVLGGFRVLHLLEDLRAALELMDNEERDNLRCQIPDSTAEGLAEWLHGRTTNVHGSEAVYQERLSRLESDKECLILQVSVLTDQVEVQGEKIRDLDKSLEHHREKLNAAEELLQQELLNRTALETQKLELMTEVSSLKLKLTALEHNHRGNEGLYQEVTDLRFRMTDIENERLLCEKKLKVTKVSVCVEASRRPAPRTLVSPAKHAPVAITVYNVLVFYLEDDPLVLAERLLWVIHVLMLTAEMEQKGTEHLDLAGVPSKKSRDAALPASSPEAKKKPKGLMKFFGRSHSTSFNLDDSDTAFRRGGVRATAGPRLGWSSDSKHKAVDVPFARWDKDEVSTWLHEQGLGVYAAPGQNWIKSGQTLLQASQHDLEKELGMKQPLHRKKLQLALQALGTEDDDLQGKLDHNWVTRWLDDIGLPQYKSNFDEARVDGRMLHYMTVEDLLSLKVGSVLHHLSIKRAIQVLRLNSFEPNCVRRRPSDENNLTPAEISQWTNHRVMEWLRSVDLAEYAPNLRGSGVHGGLMVLEPRFNVEALALLLNIPPSKTLLRRHLATHFHLLVGSEAQRQKQEGLENPDYSVLTATARVKPRRSSFGGFGSLRRRRDDCEDYVCPLNIEMPKNSSFHRNVGIYEDNLDPLEQVNVFISMTTTLPVTVMSLN